MNLTSYVHVVSLRECVNCVLIDWMHLSLQEDEDEMARRKMREEDAEVDIFSVDEVVDIREMELRREVKDDDVLWAESEPDMDEKGWRMKILMIDEDR